jgi:hypothetical protein
MGALREGQEMMTGRQRIRSSWRNASITAALHFMQVSITCSTRVVLCLIYLTLVFAQLSSPRHHAARVYCSYCSFSGFLDFPPVGLFYLTTCHVFDFYSCTFTNQFILFATVIWMCDFNWDMRLFVPNKVCMAQTRIQGLKRTTLHREDYNSIVALFALPRHLILT